MATRSMGKTIKLNKQKNARLGKALSRSSKVSVPKSGNLAYTASQIGPAHRQMNS